MDLYVCRKEHVKENKVCFTDMYKPYLKRMTYKMVMTLYIYNFYENYIL